MSKIANATALVTGGASGIGYLVGRELLEAGAGTLVIWDINESALAAAVTELRRGGRQVAGFKVDVADLAEVQSTLTQMRAQSLEVDVLINNAGIVVGKDFADHAHDDIERTMRINALAPMHLARAVLPGMIARGHGHIVNIASAAGMISNPRMSVYCASKWAVIGWSDSLRIELEHARTGVNVTTVTPYYINTGMFAGVKSRPLPLLEPAYVARRIVNAVQRDRILLRIPSMLNLLPLMRGMVPTRWFDKVAGEWLGVYDAMTSFTGRT